MTVRQNEIRDWLNRAFYADKKVKVLEMLLKQCRERAEGAAVCYDGNDKGKSSSSENSTENVLIKLVDTEHKLQQQITGLASISGEIFDAISKINDDDLETVLIHRFLLFHTVEETAEIMNYGRETVKRKTNQAIEKLSRIELE